MPNSRAYAGLTAAVIIWGLNYPFVTLGLKFASPIWLAFFRSLAGFLGAVALLYAFKKHNEKLTTREKTYAALLGIPGSVLFFGFWFLGSTKVPPGVSSVLINSFPLWILFLSIPMLGDRPKFTKVGAAFLGFAGVFLVSQIGFVKTSFDFFSVLELAIAGFCFGLLNVSMKRLYKGEKMLQANAWQLGASLIPLAAWAQLGTPVESVHWSLDLFAVIIWIGVLGTAIVFHLWFTLLSKYNAASLSSYFFMIVVVALISSYFIFGEKITPIQGVGVGAIIISVYFVNRNGEGSKNKEEKKEEKGIQSSSR